MTLETNGPPKKNISMSDDPAAVKKPSVKKKKKIGDDNDTNASKKSSATKKSSAFPPKPTNPNKLTTGKDAPASSTPITSRQVAKPVSTRLGLRPPDGTMNGRGNAGRNARLVPNGGAGAGRGGPDRARGVPSTRGVGRNTSYDGPLSSRPGAGNIAAPKRPQSMKALPGVPLDPTERKPQSMIGLVGASGRGNLGKGVKVMGKNAISNRNLPPPPGTRVKSKRNLMGSSHHKSSSRSFNSDEDKGMGRNAISNRNLPPPPGTRVKSKRNLLASSRQKSSRSFNSDEEDEFASDLADDSLINSRKPESILRKSFRPDSKRTNADGSISLSAHSTNLSIDEDEEFQENQPIINRVPDSNRPTLAMKKRGLGVDESEHSLRGWTQSFKWASRPQKNDRRSAVSDWANRSVRSILTVDVEFEDEPLWKQILRYLRILAPHPDEKPIKKSIRICTWLAMVLDFLTGLVSIVNYDDVAMCCGEPILSIAGDINWHSAIQGTIYLYMVLIFVEVIPVMREGLPLNLLNPFIGFLITFAMFFDDRITQAVTMWIIEATAVFCECWVYRMKLKLHDQRQDRLNKTELDLVALRKERKRRRLTGSTHSLDSSSSDLSFDEKSFHDESAGESSQDFSRPKDVSQIRETRLLRERRLLRQAQTEDTQKLRYHFFGVAFNVAFVFISLLLIIVIGRSGGLCVVDMQTPNIFKNGQLDRCYECKGKKGSCEVCRPDGSSHCYYPYY